MPTTTARLKLPRPVGTDNFNLANQQALIDAIETNAAQRDDYTVLAPYAAVTGVANTYAATVTPAPTTYTDGMAITIKINVTNTAVSTLNVNGLGAKAIRKPDGSDVVVGELVAGSVYTLRYNGTVFIIQGSASTIDYMKHGVNGTTSGSANAYTLTPSPALSLYADFLRITVVFHVANTGAATINISGLGARTLKKSDGTDFTSGELKTSTPYTFVLTGSNFIRQGEGGAAQTTLPAALFNNWFQAANLNNQRLYSGAAVVNDLLYAIGGGENAVNTVEAYSPDANTWISKANLLTARGRLAAAEAQGKIYAIGGANSSGALNTVEMYDPTTNAWTNKANMTNTRLYHTACEVNGKIYVCGGQTGVSSYSNTVEMYDPITNTWSNKANMNFGRTEHGASVVNSSIVVAGGRTNTESHTKKTEIYDVVSNVWTNKADLSRERNGLVMFTLNNKVYAVGGDDPYVAANTSVEMYDAITNAWVSKKNLPAEKMRGGSGVIKGNGYIFGGSDGSQPTLTTYIYIP